MRHQCTQSDIEFIAKYNTITRYNITNYYDGKLPVCTNVRKRLANCTLLLTEAKIVINFYTAFKTASQSTSKILHCRR